MAWWDSLGIPSSPHSVHLVITIALAVGEALRVRGGAWMEESFFIAFRERKGEGERKRERERERNIDARENH